jgi:hypothetical protein
MKSATSATVCKQNAAVVQPLTGRPRQLKGNGGTGGGTGTVPNPIKIQHPPASELQQAETLNKEYAGAATVTQATVLGDFPATSLTRVHILVRQVATAGQQVAVTAGGNTVNYPLGGSVEFVAPTGAKLDDFSVAVPAGAAINVSAVGI